MFTVAGLFPLKPEMSVRDRNQSSTDSSGSKEVPYGPERTRGIPRGDKPQPRRI